MQRIPFGIRRLDTTVGGGAPAGSVVLLSGEAGAGAREFTYTSTVMNGLIGSDPDLFDLYYGGLEPAAEGPGAVHYVSFTTDERQVRNEMELAMDEELVDSGLSNVTFHDLSPEYFRISPVPREWYTSEAATITGLGANSDRNSVPEALGDRLTEHASGNVVVLDSLTDLIASSGDELTWNDIPVLLKGISRAAYEWGGLILVHVNHETLTDEQHGQLIDAADGTLLFEWESGGSARARTMVVKQFRGVLSRIEEENIVRFETEIGDAGLDISDVRKIR
ncbi:HTR-like protein [Salinirubellus salinus]|uniref:HTR-like protein n=1 Tax=Salinirubellus salinus TaxID=1364945 RepID=A0A9E7R790_9EURY|nr:HTR-like protein [Salinirubellus salinus]UWM56593.1 HTR-like protein [Salinirubellus salinus]